MQAAYSSDLLKWAISVMDNNTAAFAKYYRNSLADAELGKGALSKFDVKNQKVRGGHEIAYGVIDAEVVQELFSGEPKNSRTVKVVIRPFVYVARVEHGKRLDAGLPEIVTPVIACATVGRNGRIYPTGKTVFARDLLEPIEVGSFSIGQVSSLDSFLSSHESPTIEESERRLSDEQFAIGWESFIAHCTLLEESVAPVWVAGSQNYVAAQHWYLIKEDSEASPSKHILALYDDLWAKRPDTKLFDRYASQVVLPPEPCLPPNWMFVDRLGHASDTYPLADAQRDALSHLVAGRDGDILGVNGPPGTGKTTMLLSVVASLWVDAAIKGGNPPVIIAASTNNQAVTNVIDAFGKDFADGEGPFAGRWLPDVQSFGAYFPSDSKEAEAAEKYQTIGFFNRVEDSAYVETAKTQYIAFAQAAFPELKVTTVDAAVNKIQSVMRAGQGYLKEIVASWEKLDLAKRLVFAELGKFPESELDNRKTNADLAEAHEASLKNCLHRWREYLARESIWWSLFNWLPPVAKKRTLKAAVFVNGLAPAIPTHEAKSVDDFEGVITRQTLAATRAAKDAAIVLEKGVKLMTARDAARRTWREILPGQDDNEDATLADADLVADTQVRFQLFRLATHYWEGRWLLEMEKLGPNLQGEKTRRGQKMVEARWYRRMMLTPCVVSTFFMLPKHFTYSRREGEGFAKEYLYSFADLLIVDEAGQVLPEIAGASFSLAKRALVIGDTLQIEPIWAIPAHVDIGNLIASGVIQAGENANGRFEALVESGKTASCGSVMAIAQSMSRYHYDRDLPRGMFLYEHRRCFDEIVNYCNALCYKGKLVPRRGAAEESAVLPAMGYLHIDGICSPGIGGSRSNILEAETIAAWIASNREMLESHYQKPIEQIIGVVTPFAGQVGAIAKACRAKNIKAGSGKNSMTVGTVHSLQGAERPVVLFSPAYSKHSDGRFIDRQASMLNVAVSRAKDSFLVFGDMDTFETALPGSPRRLLADHLSTEVLFPQLARQDIAWLGDGYKVLRDAAEHDSFLNEALAYAREQVMIVTPWFMMDKVRISGALGAMAAAVSRGVKVRIYTDLAFNEEHQRIGREALLQAREVLAQDGVELVIVRRVHSKIVACDSDLLCVGSFNWFSATRDGAWARQELSMVYRGEGVAGDIVANQTSLEARRVRI